MIGTQNALGMTLFAAGRHSEAREAFEEMGRIAEALGNAEGRALAAANLADVDLAEGRPAVAATRLRAAIALWTEVHGPEHPGIGEMSSALAQTELDLGQLEAARASIERAVRILGAGADTPALAEARARHQAILAALEVADGQ